MRRIAAAAAALLLLAALPDLAGAQVTRQVRPDSVLRARQDSLRRDSLRAAGDTTQRRAAGRGGVPQSPSRQFPQSDSIIDALLQRRGFRFTRYAADSVQLLAEDKEIRLVGHGLIKRDSSTLEADTVRYTERDCGLLAAGSPRLFDPAGNLMGEGMRYDACNHAGIVEKAKTDLTFGSGKWLLVGDIAVDNEEDRVYASRATITSCELTDPHYHFATRQVKWVNKRLMVSRPAVLYVADVPILWLPFVFQDTRRGRRSGVLAPQFGINDIVRFSAGYQRHVANIGYYWALSDFTDAQLSMDWYASRFVTFNGRFRYRWLDRFMAGGLSYQEMHESGGSTSRHIAWSHQQQFSLNSQLTAYLDYASSSRIISRNAVDPILAVGTIDSRLNYQRRFRGGMLNLGGSRTQSLDKPQVTASFPTIAFTPNPIALSPKITWSPGLSFTNNIVTHGGSPIGVATRAGVIESLLTNSRTSNLSVTTPLRVGNWQLSSGFVVTDDWSNRRDIRVDSVANTVTTFGENFQTGFDWTAGFGLPVLFQGRWNLQPGVSFANTTAGPFMVRNTLTGGRFVSQSKRFQFALGVAPTLFGLFPGFGPVSRFRHALSPIVSYTYAPATDIPLEYYQITHNGQSPTSLTQPAQQSISLGLSQNIEAKLRAPRSRAAADSAAALEGTGAEPPEGRKIKLLSIQTSAVGYDFEQAKQPGRTGWTTSLLTNTISSDLVHGFSMNFAHDLWQGQVGTDTARFAPMLTSMTFGFSLGEGSLNLLRRLLGAMPAAPSAYSDTAQQSRSATDAGRTFNAFQRGPMATQYSTVDRLTPARGGGAFQAQLNYSLQRQRPVVGASGVPLNSTSNSMISGSMQFSPTRHWTVSWQTSYNFTQGVFADHVVRLDRDLHDWRATFTFVKSANGNFLFNFFIQLIDEPDIKLGYDQRNIR